MRTRNTDTPRSGSAKKLPPKKTPPKPSTTDTVSTSATEAVSPPPKSTSPTEAAATTTPKTVAETATTTPKTTPSTGSKQQKSGGTAAKSTTTTPKTALKTKVEDASASVDTAKVTPQTKVTVKRVVKKTPGKTTKPTKAAALKAASAKNPKSAAADVAVESVVENLDESLKKEELVISNVDESSNKEELVISNVDKSEKKEEVFMKNVVESLKKVENETVVVNKEVGVEEEVDDGGKEAVGIADNMEEDTNEDVKGKDVQLDEEEHNAEEVMEDYGEQEGFQEPGDEECAEDDEPDEEAKGLEDEHMEISALAKERKIKKEKEIFVGGLDRDAVEEDVKKAFEHIGKIVEVRLHRNPSTNKNKGYAFVKFADKEQANKALSELKNPMIRGKRCGVAPSEDNDTIFVGNICNTWTKEAIKQKLKEYGLEGVENITLVADAQHEGLSRGFAFVEFSCHADAMLAYKRLQKPDAVFGHAERTVKVAFAEPLREPDPEIMAQVKSVFVDGLPPYWDEERVREHFKPYGEIERIVLARNMPSAKRKDFGFVDFNTHEAAIACIDGVNGTELGDEKSKSRVKVRLSNPLPKTQAVKGGLCGGFRIGRAGSGFSRFGRGLGRGGRPFNRVNFQHGKDSRVSGWGRTGRFSFAEEDIVEGPYTGFRGRRPFGGRGGRRGYNEEYSSRAATSSRPDLGRSRYGANERGRGKSIQARRQPFSPEGHFSRPVGGRHFVDDPYLYDDGGYGIKRPSSMLDHEPGYLEPSRVRPRFDHPDPVASSRATRYQDSLGTASGLYSSDYYSSAYGGSGAYSSMYGGDHSYGGGYYY